MENAPTDQMLLLKQDLLRMLPALSSLLETILTKLSSVCAVEATPMGAPAAGSETKYDRNVVIW